MGGGSRGMGDGGGIVGAGVTGVESGRRGVCDGTDVGAVGARVMEVESGRHGVCDGIGTMGVGATGG